MARKVLLIEPNYKNKYPPMGLMKISTYHKMLGDEVQFFKGDFVDFITDQIYNDLIKKLTESDPSVKWKEHREDIIIYLRRGFIEKYDSLVSLSECSSVKDDLKYYRKYFNKKQYFDDPKWDRVCISTLFTFYWDKTVKAINQFKLLCKDINEVKVGGVAASLLPERIYEETGVKPHVGLLDKAGDYDDNNIIIDTLPLDYAMLNEINYKYPESDGYYGYMTRGCTRNCSFCAVPQLEPKYNCFISIKEQIKFIDDVYGQKRNLLLLDNNVLASERFDDIIDEIKECGFYKGATYVEPNMYEILIRDLKQLKINYSGHIKRMTELFNSLYKKISDEIKDEVYAVLDENKLLDENMSSKEAILKTERYFRPLFVKYHNNKKKARYVDFNQGIDARLMTPEKAKRLAEIPIRPLRIAFDSWKLRDVYENAIRLAAENGIKNMSNYLLYNYDDEPVDLYYRMKLNIYLCEELNINIYSFPMKYHPIQDPEYFSNRNYVGEHWNRKYIRSIQAILNSTKGKVGRGKQFFEKAFGRNELEYEKLLYMPEAMIIYRLHYEENGVVDEWWNAFSALSENQLEIIKPIIHTNEFSNINIQTDDEKILEALRYYTITREEAEGELKVNKK